MGNLFRLLGVLLCLLSSPVHAKNFAQTKYPIVLVHGMYGFDSILGIVDYFYKIPYKLKKHGADVHVARITSLGKTELRGEQLLEQVENIIALTGRAKVHLIGHSHGVPTARYVASVRPDLVASVLGVAGPNHGSAVADLVVDNINDEGPLGKIAGTIATSLAKIISFLSTTRSPGQEDFWASINALSTHEAARFNRIHQTALSSNCQDGPEMDSDGVRYFSMGGDRAMTSILDPLDLPFLTTKKLAFKDQKADGLVSICSSRLGKSLRKQYPMNHLDFINHVLTFGAKGIESIYINYANHLRSLSL